MGWFNFLWSFSVCFITYLLSYIPIILPILWGCETWPDIEEDQGMRVIKNDVGDVCTYKGEGNRDWKEIAQGILKFILLTEYYFGCQIKKNEVDGVCDTHVGRGKV